jgi:glutamate-1-semialdehyde 2,1-aminomutase
MAQKVLPAGSFGNMPAELIIESGSGSRIWDIEGNEYIDYLLGSGPMLLGHNHPEVTEAAAWQLRRGTTFFTNNPLGIELAGMINEAVACADMVRFVSTGSEAVAYAMRLARAYTGRDKILKFEGGFHGYSDWGLMSVEPKRHSNSSRPIPDSAGIPKAVLENIVVAPFNDIEAVERLIHEFKRTLAAVILEPQQRLIPPVPGFLQAMRDLTQAHDILLVFDEMATGFRLTYGGAQEFYGVIPDLCTLGKVIGGGFPLAAVAGRADIMALFDRKRVATDRFVPMVGTFSGNPVAAAAGIATLKVLKRPGTYERFVQTGRRLMYGLAERFERAGIHVKVVGEHAMFDVVFGGDEVTNYKDLTRGDTDLVARYNKLVGERGIHKGEAKYYVSMALTETDIKETFAIWDETVDILASG